MMKKYWNIFWNSFGIFFLIFATVSIAGAWPTGQPPLGNTTITGNLAVSGTRGTELVTNGTFDADTSWTKGAGWTISGGVAVKGEGAGTLSQDLGESAGETYEITYTISQTLPASTSIFAQIGSHWGLLRSSSGTYTEYITAIDDGDFKFIDYYGGWTGTIDNVSVKKITSGAVTIDGQTIFHSPIIGRVPVSGSIGVWGNSQLGGVYDIFGLGEFRGTCPTGSKYCNSFYVDNKLISTGAETTATTDYSQTQLAAPSGTPSYSSDITHGVDSISYRSPGAVYTIGETSGRTITYGENAQSTGTYNDTNRYGLKIQGSSVGGGTHNVSDTWSDISIESMDAFASGTVANKIGLRIAKQTIGTNNYGIWLNGNGSGADIVLGANKPAKGNINFDGDKLQVASMPLNDLGTRSVCQAWAQIVNPDICFGVFPHATPTTETAMIGNNMTLTYNNVSESEITPQGLAWVLNGTGNNEYLTRADSGSSLSYTSGGFSGAIWAYVADTADSARGIIAKSGAAGHREYKGYLTSSEVFYFSINDSTNGGVGTQYSTTALTVGWNLLGWSYTGGTNVENITLYANGVALSGAASGAIADFVSMQDTDQQLEISNTTNGTAPFRNKIGAGVIGAGAWTADQHLKIYNSSKVMMGL